MKNIFQIIGFVSLICFSFYYTGQISTVIKNSDDLMKEIEMYKGQNKVEPIDATINNDTIIPGLSGKEINVSKSYNKMKQLNKFNSNLIIYDYLKPKVSVNKRYDKYIVSGNRNKKEIALVFLINGDDKVDSIIKSINKTTFFVDGKWFENNNELVLELISYGNIIGNMGYDESYNNNGISWMNTIVKKIGNQKNTFCYTTSSNETILNRCKLDESYTIIPNIVVKRNFSNTIKDNLTNGFIIAIDVNEYMIKELPLMLNLIKSKGFNLVTLEELLNE